MAIWLDQDQAIIRDFSRRELFLYYTEELGGYDLIRHVNLSENRVAAGFRDMFATMLPCFSATMIHGAGVILDNRSALFLAHSTGGKTTVTEHSSGRQILSDDQIILRRGSNGVVSYATPFGRKTSGPCSAKIKGLFLLEKAKHFELKQLDPLDLVQFLWGAIPSYTFFLPRKLRAETFNILYDACHQAPVYRMRFPKDYVDWDAIDAAMGV